MFLTNKDWKVLITFVRHVFNLSNQVFNIQLLKTFKNLSKFLFILLQSQFRQSGTYVTLKYHDLEIKKLQENAKLVEEAEFIWP